MHSKKKNALISNYYHDIRHYLNYWDLILVIDFTFFYEVILILSCKFQMLKELSFFILRKNLFSSRRSAAQATYLVIVI